MRKMYGLLLAITLLVAVSRIDARYPDNVFIHNRQTDGRHIQEFVVDVPTHTFVVALSTDNNRLSWLAQVTDSDGKVFWSGLSVSTSSSQFVEEGDYFTTDNPVSWLGKLELQGDTTGQVVIKTWSDSLSQ